LKSQHTKVTQLDGVGVRKTLQKSKLHNKKSDRFVERKILCIQVGDCERNIYQYLGG